MLIQPRAPVEAHARAGTRRRQRLPPGALQLGDRQRALAAGDDQPSSPAASTCPACAAAAQPVRARQILMALAAQRASTRRATGRSARIARSSSAQAASSSRPRFVAGRSCARRSRPPRAAATALARARLELGQRFDDRVGAERARACRAGCRRRHRQRSASGCRDSTGPVSRPASMLHDGDPGLAIASEQRALDRRCAAPARQQRGVDVERAVRRGLENARRKQDSVGGDDNRVRPRGAPLVRAAARRACAG